MFTILQRNITTATKWEGRLWNGSMLAGSSSTLVAPTTNNIKGSKCSLMADIALSRMRIGSGKNYKMKRWISFKIGSARLTMRGCNIIARRLDSKVFSRNVTLLFQLLLLNEVLSLEKKLKLLRKVLQPREVGSHSGISMRHLQDKIITKLKETLKRYSNMAETDIMTSRSLRTLWQG